jgi:hypothetical protein
MVRNVYYKPFSGIIIFGTIVALSVNIAFAGIQTVTTSKWGGDTLAGSLSFALQHTGQGDTIQFNFPGPDSTIIPSKEIIISKDMVILGRNSGTGKITIISGSLCQRIISVTSGNIGISNVKLQGNRGCQGFFKIVDTIQQFILVKY